METEKTILWEKFIALQAYLKKQEKAQINNLTLYLKELEKEQQATPKGVERKNIKDQSRNKQKKVLKIDIKSQ